MHVVERATVGQASRRSQQMARSLAQQLAPGLRLAALACALVAGSAARAPPRGLRELPPSMCGFAHYGSAEGSVQRLVETHLSPGVADWNIVVPMPPPCAEAQVTGVDMRVCDGDAEPSVSLSDVRSALVHRGGQLAGFAAVNVTVYCILPPATTASPPTMQLIRLMTDSKAMYDASNELSYEVSPIDDDQEASDEPEPMPLVLTKLTTTAKPTPSTTLPPIQEQKTAHVEPSLPIEVVTPPPWNPPKENKPQSLKLTINQTAPAPSLPPYPTQYPAQYPVQYPAQYRSQYPAQLPAQYPAQYPTQYPLVRPYPFTQLYSPLSLFASRLQFLQRPNQLLFFRHF